MLEDVLGLVVRPSKIPGAGRGLFAAEDIAVGAVILSDYNYPVRIDARAADSHRESGIYWLLFKTRDGDSDQYCIALGLSSMINHSDCPNADIMQPSGGEKTYVFTLRNIQQGEEILIRYFNAEEYDALQ